MKFTIEINLDVKEGSNCCSFVVKGIDSDVFFSVLKDIEDGILSFYDLEDRSND